jgi:hypothetical protein
MIGGQRGSTITSGVGSAVGVGKGVGCSENPPLTPVSALFSITFILNLHYF